MKNPFRSFVAALSGTILVALCCFTPYFAAVLSLLGLTFIFPYLDFILLPLLGAFGMLTILAFLEWKKSQHRK